MTDDPMGTTDPSPAGPTGPGPALDPAPTEPIPVTDAAQAADTGPAPAPTASTAAVASMARRARWAIGLGVAGLAIAGAVGAFVLLGARPAPEALRYLPGDSVMVIEIRMDLPGDQMQKLGNLLSKFPGFADQSTLTDKIDEAFSRLVGSASEGRVDYRADIKPWLNGPAFIGLPAAALDAEDGPQPLISATTNGAVDCATALGGSVTRETYRGLEIVTDTDRFVAGLACVVDGRQALLGDPAAVKAGLDTKANGTGLDKSDLYGTARAALGGDQLGSVFVSGEAFEAAMPMPSFGALPVPGLDALQELAGAIPEWAMVGIRAEDDALVMDTVAALPAPGPGSSGAAATAQLLPLPPVHASVLAGLLPADTILFLEDQGTGVSLQNLLARLGAIPELEAPLGMLEGLGGGQELVGWIEDVGIVVLRGQDTPSGGVLLVARDDAAAAERVTSIRNLLTLAGLGGGLDVRDSTVAGVTVTTVVVTDLGALIPPGTLPDAVEPPASVPLELSFAARGKVIIVGVGTGFMTSVLETQPGASLADQAAFRASMQRGLADSRTSFYLGVPATIDLVEGFLPAGALAEWQAEYLPYVEPFEAISITSSSDGTAVRSRLLITVSQTPSP